MPDVLMPMTSTWSNDVFIESLPKEGMTEVIGPGYTSIVDQLLAQPLLDRNRE